MGIDQPGGTDTRTENVEKPPAEDHPPAPPPDRPGSPGQPSRLESIRAAREAQEARRTETGTQQTDSQETDTEQRDEREKDKDESSSTEPTGEEPDAQAGPKTSVETSDSGESAAKAGSGTGERKPETDRSQPETEEERPDGRGAPTLAAETGEVAPASDTERPESKDAKNGPSSRDSGAEQGDALTEPRTAEDRPEIGGTGPEDGEAVEAGRPEGRDDEPRVQETREIGPESSDPRDQADRPQYPEIADRSEYVFTEREYDFAEVSPEQAEDMQAQRVPLGMGAEQWNECVTEMREALAAEGITDADVRLKGSGARFCSENPQKWFPQNEDELRAKVTEHYRNAPEQERIHRADNAVATYRAAGFSQDGPKPVAPFFDSMYKLDAATEPSDYDFQIASDSLAGRFEKLETTAPDVEWRSQHGGHFKHRHLEQVAPALHAWAQRWENAFDREVTLATFDRQGPGTGLREDDWVVIKPEENA